MEKTSIMEVNWEMTLAGAAMGLQGWRPQHGERKSFLGRKWTERSREMCLL